MPSGPASRLSRRYSANRFEVLADSPELAETFNRAMTSVSELAVASVTAAYDFSRYATIVDVAAAMVGCWPQC